MDEDSSTAQSYHNDTCFQCTALCYLIQGGTTTGGGTGLGTGVEMVGRAHITEMEVPLEA